MTSRKLASWSTPVLSVAVLTAIGFAAYSLSHQTTAPVRAEMENAKRHAVPNAANRAEIRSGFIAGNGLVEPNGEETKVGSELPGRVAVLNVTEGQKVERGALLLEFDHTVEQALLATAEAEAEVASAEFTRVKHGLRDQEVSAIVSEAKAAQARQQNAASELKRAEELASSGSVSAAELDRARRAAEAERSGYEAADARASAARTGSRHEDVAIALARVKAARARRDQAAAALALKSVYSPIKGEVLRVKVKVGEFYSPLSNQPLVLVGDTSKLKVRLDVDERDIAHVRVGALAYITATTFGDARFDGKVSSISRRIGRRTVRTDEPSDRIDVKILEILVDVDDTTKLIPGLRVTGFINVTSP